MAALEVNDITFCFLVEWFDEQAGFPRQYLLSYFMMDNTIKMHDIKANTMFLKRGPVETVKIRDLFCGGTITVHARQLKVLDYGNEYTRRELNEARTSVVAVLSKADFGRVGKVMVEISKKGLQVGRLKSVALTPAQAETYGGPNASDFSRGPVVAMEVLGLGGLEAVRDILGQDLSGRDRQADIKFFFESPLATSATFTDCTVCVIKPHILTEGCEGELVDILQREGLTISAIQRFCLDRKAAQEFLDLYFNVIPHANGMVDELQSGACIAIELTGPDIQQRVRALCGPPDPEIARHLRPQTIRANYGHDVVRCAVHCTDLETDGPLESDFLFSTVQTSELVKTGNF